MGTRADASSHIWRILAAALAAAALSAAPAPAFADEGDCSRFVESPERSDNAGFGTRVYFSPPNEDIPPPLLPFWDQRDCATKEVDRHSLEGDGSRYFVAFVDIDYALFVDILRSFESVGWIMADDADMSVDEMAALSPDPRLIQTAFLNAEDDGVLVEYASTGAGAGEDLSSITVNVYLYEFGSQTTGTGFADPSVLSSLQTIQESIPNATQTAVLGASAVMLMLVVGYPGALLNSVIASRYTQVANRVRARFGRRPANPGGERDATVDDATALAASTSSTARRRPVPQWLVWPGFAAAAVIGGFVDPQFGVNGMSVRLLLTGMLSFVVLNLAGWTLVMRVFRRIQKDAAPRITFRWGSLVLVAITVGIARLLDFQPGVIFGLVAGLAFASSLTASRNALVVLLGSGFGLIVALLGWVGYSLIGPVAAGSTGNAFAVFVAEFFSGVTIEGISTLPLALLPLLALDGATLFAWKRWVWALSYIVGAAAFMLVLQTIPDSWGEIDGDFVKWGILFVSFGILATAVWVINFTVARRKERARPIQPSSTAL